MKRIFIASVLIVHLALVSYCFGFAIARPEQCGMLPILVYCVDLPASFLFMQLQAVAPDAYTARMVFDASLFFIFGTLWWCVILWLIFRVWRCFTSRKLETGL